MKYLGFLENKYKGQRLFILGSGKSLKGMPLQLLKDEYTFGINRIGMVYHPTFFWLATSYAKLLEYRSTVDASIKAAKYAFIANFLEDTIPHAPNMYFINVLDAGSFPTRPEPGTLDAEYWINQDVANGKISAYGHSGFAVFRLAAFMGFNPIFLLGFDAHYESHPGVGLPDPNHFDDGYESGEMEKPPVLRELENRQVWDAHNITMNGFDLLNIAVFNAGRDTKLTQYPRVRFEDLFQ
jgi:hypothetical protein